LYPTSRGSVLDSPNANLTIVITAKADHNDMGLWSGLINEILERSEPSR
jgi:hypothetical protein